jgi:hypothetical protein
MHIILTSVYKGQLLIKNTFSGTVKHVYEGHSGDPTVKPVYEGHSRDPTVKHVYEGHSGPFGIILAVNWCIIQFT